MLIKMVLDSLTNAIKRARRYHLKVRQLEDETFLVYCDNPDHPEPHVIRFEERKDGVYACCDCPSRVACHHLIPAWLQREHVQEVRRASLVPDVGKNERADKAPLARLQGEVEKVGGIGI
jgi:hypothetical protein